jgi:hypothetical protein
MRKLLANLAIALGVIVATFGLIGTPVIQDLLPVDFMLSAGDKTTQQYLRAVPATAQSTGYLPYVLLVTGVVLFIVGVLSRRRLRGVAA